VIARELGGGSVVVGTVPVVGERLRVNVQLIDAATDEHLWAEGYDRTLDDVFTIESDVAQRIVAAVGAALTSAEQGRLQAEPTANAEAYRLHPGGANTEPPDGSSRTGTAQGFSRRPGPDPDFALARHPLASAWRVLLFGYDPRPRAARQREEAESALRLGPTCRRLTAGV
jgi:hypothetical protein